MCSRLTHRPRALEELTAKIMKQAGVVQKEPSKPSRLNRIRGFAHRSINVNSSMDDITAYKDRFTAITDDIQARRMRGTYSGTNAL